MFFRQLLHEEKACASYLIGCPSMGVCAVVDPQGDPDVYVHQVEDNAMVIQAVIETHVHADHLSEWTEVYPGHYAGSVCGQGMDGKPVTTIGRERRFNPTFQLSQEAFVSKIAERMLPLPADFHAIKRRNSGWQ